MSNLHKKIPHFVFFFIFAVVIFTLFFSIRSWAQSQPNGQSLEVSPPSQDITGDPGKIITIKAKVINRNNTPNTVKVRLEDFTAQGDEGQVALVEEGPYSVTTWSTISPDTFTLAPGEEKEITATVHIPKTAAGGRYGSFVFSLIGGGKETGSVASLSQEIASLFLLRISGPVNEHLMFTGFQAPQFSEYGPVPFNLTFKNDGNVHVKTFGLINVQNMFGQKVADVVVPGTNVFPSATRIIHAELDRTFLFGPYTATAIMYYGVGNQTLTATTGFTVFPLKLAVITLLILIFLYMGRKRIGKAINALFK